MASVSTLIRFAGKFGGYELARLISQFQPRILMYHRFARTVKKGYSSHDAFEAQVAYIKRRFQPMRLIDLVTVLEQQGRAPKNTVVITIDDGYHDFYDVAVPILERYQVPATVFATTGFIDGRLWLWPDKISWMLENAPEIPDLLHVASGKVHSSCRDLWQTLVNCLLRISEPEKLEAIESLSQQLRLELPNEPPAKYRAMSWNQLRELETKGFEVGGHTVSHPTLGQVTEESAWQEIKGTQNELTTHLGRKRRTFCYPNGQPADYQPFLPRLVNEAGFAGAVTAFPDAMGAQDRYAMRRHSASDNMFQFMKAVSGIEYLGYRLRGEIKLPASSEPS